jgi:hypothetical protein
MKPLPRLKQGTIIWRPVILHALQGLIPQIIPFSGGHYVDRDGGMHSTAFWTKAVWSDVDRLGAPPYSEGWRASAHTQVGTPVLVQRRPIPADWTHIVVQELDHRRIDDGPARTVALGNLHTRGKDKLRYYLWEWYRVDRGLPDLCEEPEPLSDLECSLFAAEGFAVNWAAITENKSRLIS